MGHRQFMQKLCTLAHVENPSPKPPSVRRAANGSFEPKVHVAVGFMNDRSFKQLLKDVKSF